MIADIILRPLHAHAYTCMHAYIHTHTTHIQTNKAKGFQRNGNVWKCLSKASKHSLGVWVDQPGVSSTDSRNTVEKQRQHAQKGCCDWNANVFSFMTKIHPVPRGASGFSFISTLGHQIDIN